MMPFAGGIESAANASLILSVGAATIYGFMLLELAPSWRRTAIKTLAVALLAVLAFVAGGPLLLVLALAAGALGDAFLSRAGDRAFLAGLASFLVAHLLYVVLFAAGGSAAVFMDQPWRIAAVFGLAAGAVLMLRQISPRAPAQMRLPVLAYALAIACMGVAALSQGSAAVIAGSALFIVSDAILASERFLVDARSPGRGWMHPAVWATYYAAQVLITLGFLRVLP